MQTPFPAITNNNGHKMKLCIYLEAIYMYDEESSVNEIGYFTPSKK